MSNVTHIDPDASNISNVALPDEAVAVRDYRPPVRLGAGTWVRTSSRLPARRFNTTSRAALNDNALG